MNPLGAAGPPGSRREQVHHVIFHADSGWARGFDVALILAILASVAIVVLESVVAIREAHGPLLRALEWVFTVLFSVEYVLRLWTVRSPKHYARSFFGVIDLLAVLPTWISLVAPGGQVLAVVRVLRVLRVFRVLKLARYVGEASVLGAALRASRYKISVFLVTVVTIVIVVGSVMYLAEGPENGFTSIPIGIYWAIVTLTTVGYGDITPTTTLGQTLASLVMIMGYGIIAVPTGIVTAEIAAAGRSAKTGRRCPGCNRLEDDADALFCRMCGTGLP